MSNSSSGSALSIFLKRSSVPDKASTGCFHSEAFSFRRLPELTVPIRCIRGVNDFADIRRMAEVRGNSPICVATTGAPPDLLTPFLFQLVQRRFCRVFDATIHRLQVSHERFCGV